MFRIMTAILKILLMRELIGKHSGPVTRHSGESRNPENARHRERSRRATPLDSPRTRSGVAPE